MTAADDLAAARCECGHRAGLHDNYGCRNRMDPLPRTCRCQRSWPGALISSGLLDRIRADAARDALTEAADEVDSGPTFPLPPGVISALIRERAARIGGAS